MSPSTLSALARARHAWLVLALLVSPAWGSAALAQPPLSAPATTTPAAVDTDSTRLFFAPTGRSLPAGHGYAGVWEVILPVAQFGVTDRVSVGGSVWPWAGDSGPIFFFSPKVQVYRSGSAAVSVGAFGGFASGEGGVVIPFAAATFGPPDGGCTVGWFGPAGGGSLSPGVLILGFEKRISAHTRFISENWIIVTEKAGFAIGGVRVSGRHTAADFGLGLLVDDTGDVWPALVINVVWRF
jgi:hypothetical protein